VALVVDLWLRGRFGGPHVSSNTDLAAGCLSEEGVVEGVLEEGVDKGGVELSRGGSEEVLQSGGEGGDRRKSAPGSRSPHASRSAASDVRGEASSSCSTA
jgi:hypothetical protein